MSEANGLRIRVLSSVDPVEWDRWVSTHPNVFQTSAWSRVMVRTGRQPIYVVAESGGRPIAGLVAFVRVPGGAGWKGWFGRLLPMGEGLGTPFGPDDPSLQAALLQALERECRERGVTGIEWPIATTGWESEGALRAAGFRVTQLRTFRVSLGQGPDAVWKGFEKRRRNQVRRAQNEGVIVETADRLNDYLELSFEMEGRLPNFDKRSHVEMHRAAWEELSPSGTLRLYLARHCGQLLAGVLVLVHAGRAYALWAASRDNDKRNAPSLLYWEMLRQCSAEGLDTLDFLPGPLAPPAGSPAERIAHLKRTYGGEVVPMFSGVREISPVRMRLLDRVRRWRENLRTGAILTPTSMHEGE